eukprot:TRINITY_DN3469_c0_g1_i1.p1 TRINITY_DN3469_c0_g1~~TRINITY_DN3469_c0_g1_i1.p1  ORF type:complete len:1263 (+),score=328.44 TRINITY_DN3469_c0_g1_i1:94-3789(+)
MNRGTLGKPQGQSGQLLTSGRGRGRPRVSVVGIDWGAKAPSPADAAANKETNLADVMRQQQAVLSRITGRDWLRSGTGSSSPGASPTASPRTLSPFPAGSRRLSRSPVRHGSREAASPGSFPSHRSSLFLGLDEGDALLADLSIAQKAQQKPPPRLASTFLPPSSAVTTSPTEEFELVLEGSSTADVSLARLTRSRSDAAAHREALADQRDALANPTGELSELLFKGSKRIKDEIGLQLDMHWYDPPVQERAERFMGLIDLLRYLSGLLQRATGLAKRVDVGADVKKQQSVEADKRYQQTVQTVKELETRIAVLEAELATAHQYRESDQKMHAAELSKIRRHQEEERRFWQQKVRSECEQAVLEARREMRVMVSQSEGSAADSVQLQSLEDELAMVRTALSQRDRQIVQREESIKQLQEEVGALQAIVNDYQKQEEDGRAGGALQIAQAQTQLAQKEEERAAAVQQLAEAREEAANALAKVEELSRLLLAQEKENHQLQARVGYLMRLSEEGRQSETVDKEAYETLQRQAHQLEREVQQQEEQLEQARVEKLELEVRLAAAETADGAREDDPERCRSAAAAAASLAKTAEKLKQAGFTPAQLALHQAVLEAEIRAARASALAEYAVKKQTNRDAAACVAVIRDGHAGLLRRCWQRFHRWATARAKQRLVDEANSRIRDLQLKYEVLLQRAAAGASVTVSSEERQPSAYTDTPESPVAQPAVVDAGPWIKEVKALCPLLTRLRAQLLKRCRGTAIPEAPTLPTDEPPDAGLLCDCRRWTAAVVALLAADRSLGRAQAVACCRGTVAGFRIKRVKKVLQVPQMPEHLMEFWGRQLTHLRAQAQHAEKAREELRAARRLMWEKVMQASGVFEESVGAAADAEGSASHTVWVLGGQRAAARRLEAELARSLVAAACLPLRPTEGAAQQSRQRSGSAARSPMRCPAPQAPFGPLAPKVAGLSPPHSPSAGGAAVSEEGARARLPSPADSGSVGVRQCPVFAPKRGQAARPPPAGGVLPRAQDSYEVLLPGSLPPAPLPAALGAHFGAMQGARFLPESWQGKGSDMGTRPCSRQDSRGGSRPPTRGSAAVENAQVHADAAAAADRLVDGLRRLHRPQQQQQREWSPVRPPRGALTRAPVLAKRWLITADEGLKQHAPAAAAAAVAAAAASGPPWPKRPYRASPRGAGRRRSVSPPDSDGQRGPAVWLRCDASLYERVQPAATSAEALPAIAHAPKLL